MEKDSLQRNALYVPNNLLCCLPAKRPMEELIWLPSPVLESDKTHYMDYESVTKLGTTEETDRPSLKIIKDKDMKQKPSSTTSNQTSIETFQYEQPSIFEFKERC